jgi:hypothetical protein
MNAGVILILMNCVGSSASARPLNESTAISSECFVYGCVNQTMSIPPLPVSGVHIISIGIAPAHVRAGESFTIDATVFNNTPRNITYLGGCESPISATFDPSHVVVIHHAGCFSPHVALLPGHWAEVSGPSSDTTYRTISVGLESAVATFTYDNTQHVARAFVFYIDRWPGH